MSISNINYYKHSNINTNLNRNNHDFQFALEERVKSFYVYTYIHNLINKILDMWQCPLVWKVVKIISVAKTDKSYRQSGLK